MRGLPVAMLIDSFFVYSRIRSQAPDLDLVLDTTFALMLLLRPDNRSGVYLLFLCIVHLPSIYEIDTISQLATAIQAIHFLILLQSHLSTNFV